FSGGVPRRINTLCDRLLLFGYLEERTHLDSAAVQEVISDLQQEVHHQAPRAHRPEPAEVLAATHVPPTQAVAALPENLEERLLAMERSLNRLAPLVRKVLFTVTSGRETE
ncbi:MAG: ATPase, partial [Thiobacillaceae bacterium]|nr:ATPase [Thiobacillaceae bacterium]